MDAETRAWLRAAVDQRERERAIAAGDRKVKAATVPVLSPDGFCCALLNLGTRWTRLIRARCSRRATAGRFCRTHVRKRVGEIA